MEKSMFLKNMFLATDTRISTDFSDGLPSIREKQVEIRVSVAFSCLFSNWSRCLKKVADTHIELSFQRALLKFLNYRPHLNLIGRKLGSLLSICPKNVGH
jgi:hypothetical protein